MKFYVANCTTQRVEFMWRMPENPKLLSVTIQPTSQTCLGDLTQPQIDAIVEHHSKYGMVNAIDMNAADARRKTTSSIYSVGHPVPSGKIEAILLRNYAVLDERGKLLRKEAAVASNDALARTLAEQNRQTGIGADIKAVEMTIVEEEPSGGYTGKTSDHVAEKLVIEKDFVPTIPLRGRRRA